MIEPRLISSKKFVNFPPELISQIRQQFLSEFLENLQGMDLYLEGRIYPEEIIFRIGFKKPGDLQQKNFLTSKVFEPNEALDCIYQCVDGATSMANLYFESLKSQKIGNPEVSLEKDLPQVWSPFEFDDLIIHGQFSSFNDELEKATEAFLGSQSADSGTDFIKVDAEDPAHELETEEQRVYDSIVHEMLHQLKH